MVSFQRISYEELSASPLAKCIDLATSAVGGSIVKVTDEFFAPATNMINAAAPISCPGRFVATGAWMDGWETKRHNATYDWAVVKLGFPGSIRGFDIDTHYFTGNQAPAASVEAAFVPNGDALADDVKWVEVLPKIDLPPSCHNVCVLDEVTPVYTHVRLNNIPDGGIARFRVYGTVQPLLPEDINQVIDLAYSGNGGRVVEATEEHYGPASNLLLPGRGKDADDGWQSKRSREPNHADHAIIKLGAKGHIVKAELDTSDFKGNFPNRIMLEATNSDEEIPGAGSQWETLVDKSQVGPHGLYQFDTQHTDKVFTHAKISIIPDGALKRLRLYGVRDGATLPSLPLALPSPKNVIIAEPLTTEAFAPYGDVIDIDTKAAANITEANQGTAKKCHHVAQIYNNFPGNRGKVNMCIFRCAPTNTLPFTIKILERHPYSSQFFIPMTSGQTRGYLVAVALNGADDKPDMSTLKVLVAQSTQGVNYRQGVWHHPMIALEDSTDFAVYVHESGVPEEDCNIVDVEHYVAHVPGFHN
ncbi:Allantoicase [Hesseltinella vesiculosa]|uniref:Allantoicase n=1 Tax=Hesseltinella vesiculosa TaxID=101127 RepID=A0A1X2GNS5_9FUNG|nr:Allantoicase [Hesseltinella vesiculosa]